MKLFFSPDEGVELSGVIIKYNKKTLTVRTDNGQKWKVHARILRKKDDESVIEVVPSNRLRG